MRLTRILFIAAISVAACSSPQKIKNDDFTTTGFIAKNCFQVIVSASPDSKTCGLVNQRESSYSAAKQKISGRIQLAMAEYVIDREIANRPPSLPENFNREKTVMSIEIDINRYIKRGYIAVEYYREDHSVILAYRIVDSSIKRRLDSISVDLKFD